MHLHAGCVVIKLVMKCLILFISNSFNLTEV
jgi:hypothetical protein